MKNILDDLYPLLPENELPILTRIFYNELTAALSNQQSSIPCILNPINKLTPKPGFGVAVSIGGTNGYASGFRINKAGAITFLNREIFSLPEQTTIDGLFTLITENVLAVAGKRKHTYPIGIGFAYPLRPFLHEGHIDGELPFMSKGRTIEGLVGKQVGREYHRFLIEKYGIDTRVSVANDAICLLLGGDGADVAGVVGTGLNFAYWQSRGFIAPLKLRDLSNFSQAEVAVNIESRNFTGIPETTLRQIVDKKSDDPGYSLAEKEVSGAYLYKIFNAGKKEIIGEDFPDLISTDQLNDMLTGAFVYPKLTTHNLQLTTEKFAERIFRRSAQIVAIELCGILMKIGKTKGMVPIVMEGGLFWKAKNYSTFVNYYIHLILPELIPSFARLFGSSRRGIAILANAA
jgi:hexokinase